MIRSTLPVVIAVLCFAGISSAVKSPAARTRAAGGPHLVLDSTRADFGSVPHGAVVRRTFRLRNRGSAVLRIHGVSTTCGCTVAELTSRSLDPGAWADITVEFDTNRKPIRGREQRFENKVTLSTNDPEAPLAQVALVGSVTTLYRMSPAVGAHLKSYTLGASEPPAPARVQIVPMDGDFDALKGARLLSAPASVRVEGPEVVEDDAGNAAVEITVYPREDIPAGPIRGRVQIETGDPRHPVLAVPLRGQVVPSVRAFPAVAYVTADARPARVGLKASREGVRVLHVEVSESDGGSPSVALSPLPEDPVLPLNLSLSLVAASASGPGPLGPRRGTIRFHLSDPFTPVSEVRYRVVDRIALQKTAGRATAERVQARPTVLELRTYTLGKSDQVRLTVKATGREGIALEGLRVVGSDLLSVRAEPVVAGRSTRLHLSIDARRQGPIHGEIRYRPRPGGPELSIPVHGRVAGRVEASPAGVYLTAGRPEGAVILRRWDEKPIAVLEVLGGEDRVEVTTEPDPDGNCRLRVKAREGAPAGPFRTALTVRTDSPGEDPLVIPVFGDLQ